MADALLLTHMIPLAVYGAGEIGRIFARRARKQGYDVVCFFDRMLAGGTCDGLPVLTPNDPVPGGLEKDALVVMVCLADGIQHKDVAVTLHAAGYHYIVSLPIGLPLTASRCDTLTRQYNNIYQLRQVESVAIAPFQDLRTPDYDVEAVVLGRECGKVTVLADAELVFSEDYSAWQGDTTKVHADMRYSDVNLAAYDYYYALFDYLSGRAETCQAYHDGFQNHLEGFSVDISGRGALYEHFCRELDRGLGFFIEAAADAHWSARGYFNLVGGHHRSCFLFFRKHRLLPIRISEEDFAYWCNSPRLGAVTALLEKNKIEALYGPTPHPALRCFPARRETHLDSVYSALYAYLGTAGLTGQTVVDICDDEGYYARLLCRLKADAVWSYEPTRQKADMTAALNALLHLSHIRVAVGAPDRNDSCSFLVVMDRAIGLDSNGKKALIAQANVLAGRRMLWESCAENFDEDRRYILAHTDFTQCNVLLHPVTGGQKRTVAIFEKLL